MNKKLTLSLDETVIEKAKIYADQTGKSLSGLVENFFLNLTSKSPSEGISERISKISGKIELPADFDYKEELRKRLEEKHLK
jgi:hypothetical protein